MSKILIVTRGNLPSRAANSVQIYKTAKYMSELGHIVYLTIDHNCNENSIKDFYGDSGIIVINAFPFRNGPNLRKITNWFYKRKISKYIINLDIDVVFTRDLLLLPKVRKKTTVIWETHDWNFNLKVKERIINFPKLIVVTISDVLRTRLFKIYNIRSKVLHDACEHVDFLEEKAIQKKVVFTGHLYENRGIDQILRIAGELPYVTFEIYGGLENDITYWESQNQNKNVTFKGFVDPKYIQSIQAKSAILIINYSRNLNTANYCSPLKLTEYISTGNIVITSKFGPIIDEFIDYVHAFEPDDDQSLIETLINVYKNYDELLRRQRELVLAKPPLSWLDRCRTILEEVDTL